MGTVAISSLAPGMILEDDIRDRCGRTLLRAGQTLTPTSLRVLKIWGVTEAAVAGECDAACQLSKQLAGQLPGLAPCLEEAARCRVLERFRFNRLDHPAIAEMIRHATERQANRQALLGDVEGMGLAAIANTPPADAATWVKLDPRRFVREDEAFGSLPAVFHKLVQIINDSRSSAADVAEIISNDPDLSARVLRVVNSPLYGLSSRIDTVSRAVAILGGSQLVSLAMGVCVVGSFKGIPSTVVDMRSFWKHSLAVAIGARLLASMLRLANTERLFVAGLLHDIGRLAIYKLATEQARQALAHAHAEGILLREAELRCLGFTHDRLGGLLLEAWLLPHGLVDAVRCHHDLGQTDNPRDAACVHMADLMAGALELGASGDRYLAPLDAAAWQMLGLGIASLREAMRQTEAHVEETLRFFLDDIR